MSFKRSFEEERGRFRAPGTFMSSDEEKEQLRRRGRKRTATPAVGGNRRTDNPSAKGEQRHPSSAFLRDIFGDICSVIGWLWPWFRILLMFLVFIWLLVASLNVAFLGIGHALSPIFGSRITQYLIPFGSYERPSAWTSSASTLPGIGGTIMCSAPFIGPWLPYCGFTGVEGTPLNSTEFISPQDRISEARLLVGQNHELAEYMDRNELSIAKLRHNVAASELQYSGQIGNRLISLEEHTGDAARYLHDFTPNFDRLIDSAILTNGHASRRLQKAQDDASKFTIFRLFSEAPEEELRHTLLESAKEISTRVDKTMDLARDLDREFTAIQSTLQSLSFFTSEELKMQPNSMILVQLWDSVWNPNQYARDVNHKQLLQELTRYYEQASTAMQLVISALRTIKSELKSFQEKYENFYLDMARSSLEELIEAMRSSNERLENARMKMSTPKVDDGQRASSWKGRLVDAVPNVVKQRVVN
ncbi:MAG: hypothetical protein Q9159_001013 [Coniocarpon cinnabarinum]